MSDKPPPYSTSPYPQRPPETYPGNGSYNQSGNSGGYYVQQHPEYSQQYQTHGQYPQYPPQGPPPGQHPQPWGPQPGYIQHSPPMGNYPPGGGLPQQQYYQQQAMQGHQGQGQGSSSVGSFFLVPFLFLRESERGEKRGERKHREEKVEGELFVP